MRIRTKEPIIGAIVAIGLSIVINLALRAVRGAKDAREQLESYAATRGITIERPSPLSQSPSSVRKPT